MNETNSPTKVSVVIVSWNSGDDVQKCVESLLRHTVGVELEVIVVDNASTDETVPRLRAQLPTITLIENATNVGFACASNQGMAASTGSLILLLNGDTYTVNDVVSAAAERLKALPGIAMLGCELRYPDGRLQHPANRALSVRHSLLDRLWLYKLIPPQRRAEVLLDGYWEERREIEADWLAGAFLLLRREVFESTGGFDSRFFMYGEDSEWGMRLRRMGYRILHAPTVGTVYHTGSISSDLVWTERERLIRCYRGGVEAYAAVHGRVRSLGYRLAELVGTAVRWAVYRAAGLVVGNDYYARQAEFYGFLARFYLTMPTAPMREVRLGTDEERRATST